MAEWGTSSPGHLVDLLETTAESTPDRTAIHSRDGAVTYRELHERAGRLAALLRADGIGPGDVCGVLAGPSTEGVVAILAVVRAGAAYLPLCPSLPPARIDDVVVQARPRLVLSAEPTERTLTGEAPVLPLSVAEDRARDVPAPAAPPAIQPEDAVMVLFTSGSTGTPKGVVVPHRALLNRILWGQREYPVGADDRLLHHTRYIYDFSAWEVFAPLAFGATLVVGDFTAYPDFDAMAETIQKHDVTMVHFVPSVMSGFLGRDAARQCTSLSTVFSGGESLPASLARRVTETYDATLYNQYGPTETCIDSTFFRYDPAAEDAGGVPIGRAVDGTRLYVLDDQLRPTPDGVTGELHIAGVGLATGYLGRPDLTAERFVPDPFGGDGERMYRTGDVVRRRPDGNLEFVGRTDRQVNVRGVRVELGEVEAALTAHAAVTQAVALVTDDERAHLVAWVAAAPGTVDGGTLREFVQRRLPRPFVPDQVVVGDTLPLLPTGKVDHAAVRDLVAAALHRTSGADAPGTGGQEAGGVAGEVAALWRDILEVDQVGPDDDFFELGGHSLLAVEMVSVLNERLGSAIDLADFFESPTVRTCATLIEADGAR
ncbi:non-ribosomal peptide synthetase [Micromonospora echinofusca]|uniref:non-ribosomal peptide synthetase n=1 Tax=Micromonospora echinofusca TaxID=47858 RepID=UPI003413B388